MRNIYLVFIISSCFIFNVNFAQPGTYLGAGRTDGVRISSSSNSMGTEIESVIDGSGLDVEYMNATRFLAQAAMGSNEDDVKRVLDMGMEGWIDYQKSLPPSFLSGELDAIFSEAKSYYDSRKGQEDDEYYGPWGLHFNYAWWQVNMTNEDLLRHRIALALSEILVVSMNSDLIDFGPGLANYYDLFLKHAFGNYRDLLYDVTLHPCMGYYLSHLSNPKSDETKNIHPDENYAREIMQLFTIGLFELNQDGTRKTNSQGKDIPTYDNTDIKELAKVFTGMSGSAWSQDALDYFAMEGVPVPSVVFGEDIYVYSRTQPMKMYENWHETGKKTILKNHVIPSGQSGLKDVNDAIDILFQHENVGPFLATRLIQRMVKSNPSPAYVKRVAAVFANNGKGKRGDIGAVVKAILLDDEARSCDAQFVSGSGMLREPIVRFMHYARGMDNFSPSGKYWNNGFWFREFTKQHPFMSPTVFNFFLPDYQPVGDFTAGGIVGPEFQIHDAQTSVGYINQVNQWTIFNLLFFSWEPKFPGDPEGESDLNNVFSDFGKLENIAEDTEELINYLDRHFTHGRLSDDTRNIIRESIDFIKDRRFFREKAALAAYLLFISPDYTILK
jgi:uncharacterized protein (DUF1800 family)